MVLATMPAASAQDYPPPNYQGDQPPPNYQGDQPPPNYQGGPPPGYNGDDQGPGGDYGPPPGYDGNQPPPPPPGYNGGASQQQQAQDARYERQAEQWAQDNCVKSHGNVAAGAVVGGIFGALIGGAASHGRGGGVAAGALLGGTTGAVIAAGSGGGTSPGCPPGYVVRDGAPGWGYDANYDYAAPGWYRPWVWYGDRWVFRPYPYHNWYYRHYHGGYHHHY
jgi:hypothetical protein